MAPAPTANRLCELLGIRHPVLLAGMAGGYTTPALVAAVSEAGGLGTFGLTAMSVEAAAAAVREARALTDAPIAVNVLVAPPTPRTGAGTTRSPPCAPSGGSSACPTRRPPRRARPRRASWWPQASRPGRGR